MEANAALEEAIPCGRCYGETIRVKATTIFINTLLVHKSHLARKLG